MQLRQNAKHKRTAMLRMAPIQSGERPDSAMLSGKLRRMMPTTSIPTSGGKPWPSSGAASSPSSSSLACSLIPSVALSPPEP